MKIALCLAGKCGKLTKSSGDGETIDLNFTHKHFKKHLFDIHDVDVYMHTWDTECEEELINLYNPCKMLSEPQNYFGLTKQQIALNTIAFGLQSRVYSCNKVIQMCKSTHISYDYVILSRFDICFRTDFEFPLLDSNTLWISHWNDRRQTNNIMRGIYDSFFIGQLSCLEYFFTNMVNHFHINPHLFFRNMLTALNITIIYKLYVGLDYELTRRMYYDCDEIRSKMDEYDNYNENLIKFKRSKLQCR
jgi:hypothetical protein